MADLDSQNKVTTAKTNGKDVFLSPNGNKLQYKACFVEKN